MPLCGKRCVGCRTLPVGARTVWQPRHTSRREGFLRGAKADTQLAAKGPLRLDTVGCLWVPEVGDAFIRMRWQRACARALVHEGWGRWGPVGNHTGWRCEPAFFAYFLCGGKESKCRPAQGQHQQTKNTTRMPAQKKPGYSATNLAALTRASPTTRANVAGLIRAATSRTYS